MSDLDEDVVLGTLSGDNDNVESQADQEAISEAEPQPELEFDADEDEQVRKRPRLFKRNEAFLDEDEEEELLGAKAVEPLAKRVKKDHAGDDEDESITRLPGMGSDDDENINNEVEGDDDGEMMDDDDDLYPYSGYSGAFAQSRFNSNYQISSEQLREAQDIFGEAMDEIVFNPDVDQAQQDMTHPTGSFEYIQLLQNFSLDEDEIIRSTDIPERFQLMPQYSDISRERVDQLECDWIAEQFSHRVRSAEEYQALVQSIPAVLELLHIRNLEVQVIWLYHRDYLAKELNREHLNEIFILDGKWRNIQTEKMKLLKILDMIETTAQSAEEETLLSQYRGLLIHASDQQKIRDMSACIGCLSFRLVSSRAPRTSGSRRKSDYIMYCNNLSVRKFAEMFCLSAAVIGRAVAYDISDTAPASEERNVLDVAQEFMDADVSEPGVHSWEAMKEAVLVVVGTELSVDPLFRKAARNAFKEKCMISTTPTKKGEELITAFSEYFGLQCLNKKPVTEFESDSGAILFMKLLDAENKGLLTVNYVTPLSKDGGANDEGSNPMFNIFFMEKLKLMRIFMSASDKPEYAENKQGWDNARFKMLEQIIARYTAPLALKDLKVDLIKNGKEVIIKQMGEAFAKRLSVGPYYPHPSSRDLLTSILLNCPNRPRCKAITGVYVSSENASIDLATINDEGSLHATSYIHSLNPKAWEEKLKLYLFEYRPSLLVINSGGGEHAEKIQTIVEKKLVNEVNDTIKMSARLRPEADLDMTTYEPQVIIIKDDVANIFKRSTRAKSIFPDLEANACAAVSLARMAYEPLLEYCSLWQSVDSSKLFGFETIYLDLHPLQRLVMTNKAAIVQLLELKLVEAVSDVGVDIVLATRHTHYASMLAFLPGLGLRKADKLVRDLQAGEMFDTRFNFKSVLGDNVWTNACGFIRLCAEHFARGIDPLEDTRIHPVCYSIYEFVRKMCADALEVENNIDFHVSIVTKLMDAVRKKLQRRIERHPEWLDKLRLGSSFVNIIGKVGRSFEELKDSLELLDLDQYAIELELAGKGKRRAELEMIKDELRYPWLDIRSSISSLNHAEIVQQTIGDGMEHLYIGMRVGFRVLEISENAFLDNRTDRHQFQRNMRVIVRTDQGLRGFINSSDMDDEDSDLFAVGQDKIGVIVGVNFERMFLDVSTKRSLVEHPEHWWLQNRSDLELKDQRTKRWWDYQKDKYGRNPQALFDSSFDEKTAFSILDRQSKAALQAIQMEQSLERLEDAKAQIKQGPQAVQESFLRAIQFHPLFVNSDFRGAENLLRQEHRGAGAAIARPSSKGANFINITWAFQEESFQHISVEVHPHPLDAFRYSLFVDGDPSHRPYGDLDELFAEYIGRLNDFVMAVTKHPKFLANSREDVESQMLADIAQNPARIPYYFRLETGKPGAFAIVWLNNVGNTPTKQSLRIIVTSKGYQVRGDNYFLTPSELIIWFKKLHSSDGDRRGAVQQRRSRFDKKA